MSAWAAGAVCATLALALSGAVLMRGSISTRLVALQFASAAASLDFLFIAQSFGNESAFDASLALSLFSFPASLVYARFYARWL
ncbi:MAG: hypothetical protein IAI49_03275 [Candidatus Eremiobacteraeota bacterium]|nr:hypothetical protein [Candidatus Eremiobacteraeota bacterium]